VVADAATVLDALDVSAALALEGFRGNLSPLDPRCVAAREAPGQRQGTERLSAVLAGSFLWEKGAASRVQDPLSFRCIAPVHGAARVALAAARAAIEAELGSASENPVLVGDEMLANANFDATAMALALESLGQALAHAVVMAAWRMLKLMSPASGLPRFLSPRGTTRNGFATVQKTISSLEAEIRHLALPASLASLPTADGIEDFAPMTLRVAEKTGEIVERVRYIAAAGLMVAAQAVELRGDVALGAPLRRAFLAVRDIVPALDEDRPTGPDIERLAGAIGQGRFSGR
jgi:histidine ammonia-lyase